jgi:hypothetical protein
VEAERKGTLPGCSEACGANSFADASEEADLSREIFYAEAHPFFEAQLQRTLVSGSLAFRQHKITYYSMDTDGFESGLF